MALHLKSTGIDFTDFSDATESSELLDDYEEGNWIPTDNLSTSVTYSAAQCAYYKIGSINHIRFRATPSSWNSGASPYIYGLPFTAVGGHTGYKVAYSQAIDASGWSPLQSGGGSYIYWHQIDGSDSGSSITISDWRALSDFILSGWYIVA